MGVEPGAEAASIYDVLTGKTRISEVRRQVAENLWLVGSTLDLAAADLELAGVVGREMILRDKLRAEEQPFDFLLVDCPPSLGVLTLNALVAVDEVFIPLQPHFLALHGLSKLLETINLVSARLNPQLKISGVVLCMYDVNTRLATEVSENVEEFFRRRTARPRLGPAHTFQTRIRRNVPLAEAPSFGQSIFQYSPDSHGAEDYRRLAEEVKSRRVVAS